MIVNGRPLSIMEDEGVRCAKHTLQLSILDTLKNKNKVHEIVEHLKAIRAVKEVRELRGPNIMIIVRTENLPKPILECVTRWNLLYNMLNMFVTSFKSFCKKYEDDYPKLKLKDEIWSSHDEIILCLGPCSKATKKRQTEDITLTDIYRNLNVCLMETCEIGSPLSADFYDGLNQRRDIVFSTPTFQACQLLDPRFSYELTKEDRESAIAHWIRVYNRCIA